MHKLININHIHALRPTGEQLGLGLGRRLLSSVSFAVSMPSGCAIKAFETES